MEQFYALATLMGFMFLLILGVYVWTFKIYKSINAELGRIYETVNNHTQNTKNHVGEDGYIPANLCAALHTTLKEKVNEISLRQTNMQSNLSEVGGDVKTILGKLSNDRNNNNG